MSKIILVAGATGNLGKRICGELNKRGAEVKAIVRTSSESEKIDTLEKMGVSVLKIDFENTDEIANACIKAECVVSAVAGLGEVIVDLQKRILDGALKAGVQRFVPSDFCTNYNNLVRGENRNFDLRRDFKDYLDSTTIKASSIFNGAFADILKYNTPLLNLKAKSIGYWANKEDWPLDFTTMDNTAAFTAEVALDNDAPRNLQIASFQITPNTLLEDVKKAGGQDFKLQQMGNIQDFATAIKKQRIENPAGENELYAKWQQAQYMYSMFTTHHNKLSNDRYKNLSWTTSLDYIMTFVK